MLRIIQVSDLHINQDHDISDSLKKVDRLYECLKSKINRTDKIIICVCGDILDQGNYSSCANTFFDYIKYKFNEYNIFFEFIPGNHDLCDESFSEFDKLANSYTENPYYYLKENVFVREYEELDLILINSMHHKDYTFGAVDLGSLEDVLKCNKKNKIAVIHHTILSEYEDDKSSIRNSYNLIKLLEQYNVVGLLHGHTHGYSNINISEQCKVVGVGPLLKKQENISLQFNLINIVAEDIDEVFNYRYEADLDEYKEYCVYKRKNINNFSGSKLEDTYLRVVKSTKEYGCINNFNMNIKLKIDDFFEEVESIFSNEIPIAEEWQLKKSPDSLYYNHGEYMHNDEKDSIEHIKNELVYKATSSRAIIPLLRLDDVLKGGDSFLPSLDIIQFGFMKEEKTELSVSIYMRALEVKHFLKINISEIYLIIKKIKSHIRSIEDININIFAFRAQYKEKFSCFRKSDIDTLLPQKIMMYVMKKELLKIIGLLENKLELSETIIHLNGLQSLYDSILIYQDQEDKNFYTDDLIEKMKILIDSMENLQKLRAYTSTYSSIKNEEKVVEENMKELIEKFKRIEG